MLRHLHNATELTLYASLSCGAAFLGRILPAFYFPILLLRLGIFCYCVFIIARAEGNKELAIIIGSALFIGMLGGYWDYIEILLRYDLASVVSRVTAFLVLLALSVTVWFQFVKKEKSTP